MEINYEEIKSAVLNVPIDKADTLIYRERSYYVDPVSPQGPIGGYWPSTLYDGADIYIWKKVPKRFRRIIILHEVIEADLHFHQDINTSRAHEKASELEMKFAQEILESKTLLEYKNFKKKR